VQDGPAGAVCRQGAADIALTVSIGLTSLRSGETLESLCRRADAALYAAKRAGRNRVLVAEDVFSESLG
jgi:diguanylate cyclase (GGDEF)-like protein